MNEHTHTEWASMEISGYPEKITISWTKNFEQLKLANPSPRNSPITIPKWIIILFSPQGIIVENHCKIQSLPHLASSPTFYEVLRNSHNFFLYQIHHANTKIIGTLQGKQMKCPAHHRKVLNTHRVLKRQKYFPYHVNILSFLCEGLLCQNQSYSLETSRTISLLWNCNRICFLNPSWNSCYQPHRFRSSTVPSQRTINGDLHSQMPLSQDGWNQYLLKWVNVNPKKKGQVKNIGQKKASNEIFHWE